MWNPIEPRVASTERTPMTRIEGIRRIAEEHGVGLAEFFTLEVVGVFAMGPETATGFVRKILLDSAYADADCSAALAGCLQKRWLELSTDGMLVLTRDGMWLVRDISSRIHRLPESASS
jgi:hypothetical protein